MTSKKTTKKSGSKKTAAAAPRTPPKRTNTIDRQVSRLAELEAENAALKAALNKCTPQIGEDDIVVVDNQIDNVQHYDGTACAEFIEAQGLARGYLAFAIKYLWRAGKKPGESTAKDLKKAQWYLLRLAWCQPDIQQDPLWIQLSQALSALATQHLVDLTPTPVDLGTENATAS